MSARQLPLAVLAGWLVVTAFAHHARAFCQATTCDPTKVDEMCEFDANHCLTVGYPLAWQSDCVTVSVQAAGAPKQHIDYDAAAASVTRAFAAWTSANCSGGTPAITVNVMGPISCGASEYNSDRGNANIVVFREDTWPYVGGEDALGLTRVHFDPKTGEIWDSDIEVNAVEATLSVGDPVPANAVDLDSLLTHEAGHLLGLAHTLVQSATMFPGYSNGTDGLRTLAPDDIAGICAIYPPNRQASSTSCEPRHGFSDQCGAEQAALAPEPSDTASAGKGCGLSRRAPSAPASLAAALAALFGIAVIRARRGQRRAAVKRVA